MAKACVCACVCVYGYLPKSTFLISKPIIILLPWLNKGLPYDLHKKQFYSMCLKPSKWLCPTLPLLGLFSMGTTFFFNSQKFMFKDVYYISICNKKIGCNVYVKWCKND